MYVMTPASHYIQHNEPTSLLLKHQQWPVSSFHPLLFSLSYSCSLHHAFIFCVHSLMRQQAVAKQCALFGRLNQVNSLTD